MASDASGIGAWFHPNRRANLYYQNAGRDLTTFRTRGGGASFDTPFDYTNAELSVGGTYAVGARTRIYVEAGRMWSFDRDTRLDASVEASLGLRVSC